MLFPLFYALLLINFYGVFLGVTLQVGFFIAIFCKGKRIFIATPNANPTSYLINSLAFSYTKCGSQPRYKK